MIAFGTSGWRGILGYDVGFRGVAAVARAIAEVAKRDPRAANGIVIGRDPRFMTEHFARDTARIIAGAGLPALLIEDEVPTPVIAHCIMDRQLAGGINFTASHNPSQYCGMKYSMSTGGPALPTLTREVERIANRLYDEDSTPPMSDSYVVIDPRESYFQAIESLIRFDLLQDHRFAVNPLYGAARGTLDVLLKRNGVEFDIINDYRDPLFGGFPPEPAPEYIQDFLQVLDPDEHFLGLMCDGDADRFGLATPEGEVLNPNDVATVLAWYLLDRRGFSGGIGRSVPTTGMLDRVARHFGREAHETPVGFKYLGELIVDGKIALGAEESAGLSIGGHVPEKDGIIAVLLLAEALCAYNAPFFEVLDHIRAQVGTLITRRINLPLEGLSAEAIDARLRECPDQLGGRSVVQVSRTDGVKLCFADESWILYRLSGTEPVARVYAEGADEQQVAELLELGRSYLIGE